LKLLKVLKVFKVFKVLNVLKTLFLSFITAGFIMSTLIAQADLPTATFSAIVLKIFFPTGASWLWNIIPIFGVILL